MATARARRLSSQLGISVLIGLAVLAWWQPWLGLGIVIGFLGGAATFMALLHGFLWLDERARRGRAGRDESRCVAHGRFVPPDRGAPRRARYASSAVSARASGEHGRARRPSCAT